MIITMVRQCIVRKQLPFICKFPGRLIFCFGDHLWYYFLIGRTSCGLTSLVFFSIFTLRFISTTLNTQVETEHNLSNIKPDFCKSVIEISTKDCYVL